MDIPINDSPLRKALADIGVYPHEHYGIVEDIGHKAGLAHQIVRVDPQPLLPQQGTCLSVALRLAQRTDFNLLVQQTRIFVGSRFVRWLREHGHLTQQPAITDGCLVLYFAGDQGEDWRHAGVAEVAQTHRVVSKWGTWLLLRHPIEQVPSNYGFTVRAYEHPGSDGAMQLFQEFVDDCERLLPPWARPT